MQSFLTLMNENQLSLAEQRQVYENIKQDYNKLLRNIEEKRNSINPNDIDLDGFVVSIENYLLSLLP